MPKTKQPYCYTVCRLASARSSWRLNWTELQNNNNDNSKLTSCVLEHKVDGCSTSIKLSILHLKFIFCTADIPTQLSKYSRPANTSLISKVNLLLTYLFTYILTYSMEPSRSWEANLLSASQEIPRILWNPMVHYRIHLCSPSVLTWASSIQSISPHPTSWRSILILSSKLIC